MICKDRFTAFKLKNKVEKVYFALVHGELRGSGVIDAPIGLRDDSKIVRCVRADGAPSVTRYEVLFSSKEYSLLRLVLETGRTHQIRCHMAHLGHPLLGDDLYGGSRELIDRQTLHCGEMRFEHPVTAERIELSAELPKDMRRVIDDK